MRNTAKSHMWILSPAGDGMYSLLTAILINTSSGTLHRPSRALSTTMLYIEWPYISNGFWRKSCRWTNLIPYWCCLSRSKQLIIVMSPPEYFLSSFQACFILHILQNTIGARCVWFLMASSNTWSPWNNPSKYLFQETFSLAIAY